MLGFGRKRTNLQEKYDHPYARGSTREDYNTSQIAALKADGLEPQQAP